MSSGRLTHFFGFDPSLLDVPNNELKSRLQSFCSRINIKSLQTPEGGQRLVLKSFDNLVSFNPYFSPRPLPPASGENSTDPVLTKPIDIAGGFVLCLLSMHDGSLVASIGTSEALETIRIVQPFEIFPTIQNPSIQRIKFLSLPVTDINTPNSPLDADGILRILCRDPNNRYFACIAPIAPLVSLDVPLWPTVAPVDASVAEEECMRAGVRSLHTDEAQEHAAQQAAFLLGCRDDSGNELEHNARATEIRSLLAQLLSRNSIKTGGGIEQEKLVRWTELAGLVKQAAMENARGLGVSAVLTAHFGSLPETRQAFNETYKIINGFKNEQNNSVELAASQSGIDMESKSSNTNLSNPKNYSSGTCPSPMSASERIQAAGDRLTTFELMQTVPELAVFSKRDTQPELHQIHESSKSLESTEKNDIKLENNSNISSDKDPQDSSFIEAAKHQLDQPTNQTDKDDENGRLLAAWHRFREVNIVDFCISLASSGMLKGLGLLLARHGVSMKSEELFSILNRIDLLLTESEEAFFPELVRRTILPLINALPYTAREPFAFWLYKRARQVEETLGASRALHMLSGLTSTQRTVLETEYLSALPVIGPSEPSRNLRAPSTKSTNNPLFLQQSQHSGLRGISGSLLNPYGSESLQVPSDLLATSLQWSGTGPLHWDLSLLEPNRVLLAFSSYDLPEIIEENEDCEMNRKANENNYKSDAGLDGNRSKQSSPIRIYENLNQNSSSMEIDGDNVDVIVDSREIQSGREMDIEDDDEVLKEEDNSTEVCFARAVLGEFKEEKNQNGSQCNITPKKIGFKFLAALFVRLSAIELLNSRFHVSFTLKELSGKDDLYIASRLLSRVAAQFVAKEVQQFVSTFCALRGLNVDDILWAAAGEIISQYADGLENAEASQRRQVKIAALLSCIRDPKIRSIECLIAVRKILLNGGIATAWNESLIDVYYESMEAFKLSLGDPALSNNSSNDTLMINRYGGLSCRGNNDANFFFGRGGSDSVSGNSNSVLQNAPSSNALNAPSSNGPPTTNSGISSIDTSLLAELNSVWTTLQLSRLMSPYVASGKVTSVTPEVLAALVRQLINDVDNNSDDSFAEAIRIVRTVPIILETEACVSRLIAIVQNPAILAIAEEEERLLSRLQGNLLPFLPSCSLNNVVTRLVEGHKFSSGPANGFDDVSMRHALLLQPNKSAFNPTDNQVENSSDQESKVRAQAQSTMNLWQDKISLLVAATLDHLSSLSDRVSVVQEFATYAACFLDGAASQLSQSPLHEEAALSVSNELRSHQPTKQTRSAAKIRVVTWVAVSLLQSLHTRLSSLGADVLINALGVRPSFGVCWDGSIMTRNPLAHTSSDLPTGNASSSWEEPHTTNMSSSTANSLNINSGLRASGSDNHLLDLDTDSLADGNDNENEELRATTMGSGWTSWGQREGLHWLSACLALQMDLRLLVPPSVLSGAWLLPSGSLQSGDESSNLSSSYGDNSNYNTGNYPTLNDDSDIRLEGDELLGLIDQNFSLGVSTGQRQTKSDHGKRESKSHRVLHPNLPFAPGAQARSVNVHLKSQGADVLYSSFNNNNNLTTLSAHDTCLSFAAGSLNLPIDPLGLVQLQCRRSVKACGVNWGGSAPCEQPPPLCATGILETLHHLSDKKLLNVNGISIARISAKNIKSHGLARVAHGRVEVVETLADAVLRSIVSQSKLLKSNSRSYSASVFPNDNNIINSSSSNINNDSNDNIIGSLSTLPSVLRITRLASRLGVSRSVVDSLFIRRAASLAALEAGPNSHGYGALGHVVKSLRTNPNASSASQLFGVVRRVVAELGAAANSRNGRPIPSPKTIATLSELLNALLLSLRHLASHHLTAAVGLGSDLLWSLELLLCQSDMAESKEFTNESWIKSVSQLSSIPWLLEHCLLTAEKTSLLKCTMLVMEGGCQYALNSSRNNEKMFTKFAETVRECTRPFRKLYNERGALVSASDWAHDAVLRFLSAVDGCRTDDFEPGASLLSENISSIKLKIYADEICFIAHKLKDCPALPLKAQLILRRGGDCHAIRQQSFSEPSLSGGELSILQQTKSRFHRHGQINTEIPSFSIHDTLSAAVTSLRTALELDPWLLFGVLGTFKVNDVVQQLAEGLFADSTLTPVRLRLASLCVLLAELWGAPVLLLEFKRLRCAYKWTLLLMALRCAVDHRAWLKNLLDRPSNTEDDSILDTKITLLPSLIRAAAFDLSIALDFGLDFGLSVPTVVNAWTEALLSTPRSSLAFSIAYAARVTATNRLRENIRAGDGTTLGLLSEEAARVIEMVDGTFIALPACPVEAVSCIPSSQLNDVTTIRICAEHAAKFPHLIDFSMSGNLSASSSNISSILSSTSRIPSLQESLFLPPSTLEYLDFLLDSSYVNELTTVLATLGSRGGPSLLPEAALEELLTRVSPYDYKRISFILRPLSRSTNPTKRDSARRGILAIDRLMAYQRRIMPSTQEFAELNRTGADGRPLSPSTIRALEVLASMRLPYHALMKDGFQILADEIDSTNYTNIISLAAVLKIDTDLLLARLVSNLCNAQKAHDSRTIARLSLLQSSSSSNGLNGGAPASNLAVTTHTTSDVNDIAPLSNPRTRSSLENVLKRISDRSAAIAHCSEIFESMPLGEDLLKFASWAKNFASTDPKLRVKGAVQSEMRLWDTRERETRALLLLAAHGLEAFGPLLLANATVCCFALLFYCSPLLLCEPEVVKNSPTLSRVRLALTSGPSNYTLSPLSPVKVSDWNILLSTSAEASTMNPSAQGSVLHALVLRVSEQFELDGQEILSQYITNLVISPTWSPLAQVLMDEDRRLLGIRPDHSQGIGGLSVANALVAAAQQQMNGLTSILPSSPTVTLEDHTSALFSFANLRASSNTHNNRAPVSDAKMGSASQSSGSRLTNVASILLRISNSDFGNVQPAIQTLQSSSVWRQVADSLGPPPSIQYPSIARNACQTIGSAGVLIDANCKNQYCSLGASRPGVTPALPDPHSATATSDLFGYTRDTLSSVIRASFAGLWLGKKETIKVLTPFIKGLKLRKKPGQFIENEESSNLNDQVNLVDGPSVACRALLVLMRTVSIMEIEEFTCTPNGIDFASFCHEKFLLHMYQRVSGALPQSHDGISSNPAGIVGNLTRSFSSESLAMQFALSICIDFKISDTRRFASVLSSLTDIAAPCREAEADEADIAKATVELTPHGEGAEIALAELLKQAAPRGLLNVVSHDSSDLAVFSRALSLPALAILQTARDAEALAKICLPEIPFGALSTFQQQKMQQQLDSNSQAPPAQAPLLTNTRTRLVRVSISGSGRLRNQLNTPNLNNSYPSASSTFAAAASAPKPHYIPPPLLVGLATTQKIPCAPRIPPSAAYLMSLAALLLRTNLASSLSVHDLTQPLLVVLKVTSELRLRAAYFAVAEITKVSKPANNNNIIGGGVGTTTSENAERDSRLRCTQAIRDLTSPFLALLDAWAVSIDPSELSSGIKFAQKAATACYGERSDRSKLIEALISLDMAVSFVEKEILTALTDILTVMYTAECPSTTTIAESGSKSVRQVIESDLGAHLAASCVGVAWAANRDDNGVSISQTSSVLADMLSVVLDRDTVHVLLEAAGVQRPPLKWNGFLSDGDLNSIMQQLASNLAPARSSLANIIHASCTSSSSAGNASLMESTGGANVYQFPTSPSIENIQLRRLKQESIHRCTLAPIILGLITQNRPYALLMSEFFEAHGLNKPAIATLIHKFQTNEVHPNDLKSTITNITDDGGKALFAVVAAAKSIRSNERFKSFLPVLLQLIVKLTNQN